MLDAVSFVVTTLELTFSRASFFFISLASSLSLYLIENAATSVIIFVLFSPRGKAYMLTVNPL